MHRIKHIRNQLGMTQWQLAGYLGIGRTVVNMVEKGRRYLNTPALLKLARLEIIMNKVELDDLKVPKDLPVKMPVEMDPGIEKDIQLNTLVLNKRINKIVMGLQQAQNLVKVLKLLAEDDANKDLMDLLRLKATSKINRYARAADKVIRNRFLSFSNQCQAVRVHLQSTNCNVAL